MDKTQFFFLPFPYGRFNVFPPPFFLTVGIISLRSLKLFPTVVPFPMCTLLFRYVFPLKIN